MKNYYDENVDMLLRKFYQELINLNYIMQLKIINFLMRILLILINKLNIMEKILYFQKKKKIRFNLIKVYLFLF